MFIHSRALWVKIGSDFNKFCDIYSVFSQAAYVLFLVYAIISSLGNQIFNYVLLAISSAYFVFLIVPFIFPKAIARRSRRRLSHIYTALLLALKAQTLAITIYGIDIALSKVDTLSILMAALMAMLWFFGIAFEVIKLVADRYFSLISAAITKDVEPYVNFYKKVTRQGTIEERSETKADLYISELANDYRREIAEKRAVLAKQRKEEKRRKRQEFFAKFRKK